MPTSKPLPKALRARKQPAQARSSVTVETILEAAARVLDRQGLEAYNTNRVAEAAGVSVGSLYQYFPGKDALSAALIARSATSLAADVTRAAVAAADMPLEQGLALMVNVALHHQFDRPRLAAALDYLELTLPVDRLLSEGRAQILAHTVELLARHTAIVRGDLKDVAEDLLTITRAMVDAAAMRENVPSADTRNRVLRAALGYLFSNAPNVERPPRAATAQRKKRT